MANPTEIYYAHTLPGLERLAWSEIKTRLADANSEGFKIMPGRNGLTLFSGLQEEDDLTSVRMAEDFFAVLAQVGDLPWGREGLGLIDAAFGRPDVLRTAENLAFTHGLVKHRYDHLTFRIIVRIAGPQQPYRRLDVARSVGRAIRLASHGRWRAVPEGEMVELWLNHFGYDAVLGLRLTGSEMRHRDYQKQHLKASLRPSVAAALAWLSEPSPDDIFLDPFCGSGTILIERALSGWHRLLLGGDLAHDAVLAAAENFGPRHKPRQLFHWDARALPLADASVNKVASNVPFGVQVGVKADLPTLYQQLTRELARVLTPGGTAVILSARGGLLRQFAQETNVLYSTTVLPVDVLGQSAQISVLRKIS